MIGKKVLLLKKTCKVFNGRVNCSNSNLFALGASHVFRKREAKAIDSQPSTVSCCSAAANPVRET